MSSAQLYAKGCCFFVFGSHRLCNVIPLPAFAQKPSQGAYSSIAYSRAHFMRIYIVFFHHLAVTGGRKGAPTKVCLSIGFLASAGIDLMLEYYSYDMCMNIWQHKRRETCMRMAASRMGRMTLHKFTKRRNQ